MKKTVLISGLLALSTAAFAAEKKSYQVNGMHCGGCVKNVEREVCKLEGIENCKAHVVNEKKEIGTVSFSLKPGATLTEADIKNAVEEKAGYKFAGEYKAPVGKKKKN